MTMKVKHIYRLSRIKRSMWQVPSPTYGRPAQLVGVYLGKLVGTRTWYSFEIRRRHKEIGVIFMPESDLMQLKVDDLGPDGEVT